MNVTDQYPSTSDLPRIAGGQDPVGAILCGALKRYRRRASSGSYIGKGGYVCAVGAVIREAGITPKQWNADLGDSPSPAEDGVPATIAFFNVDAEIQKAAKKAIKLLNKSAIKLYPESAGYGAWSGPLEWLNQSYDGNSRAAVIACYEYAIEKRAAKVRKAAA